VSLLRLAAPFSGAEDIFGQNGDKKFDRRSNQLADLDFFPRPVPKQRGGFVLKYPLAFHT
tara:strand:- start:222 stop:401 length:180 start_codon:yes stop_codon:yes gene_type:complete